MNSTCFFSVTAKAWYGCSIACYSILLLGIVWLVECSALFLVEWSALFLSGVASSHRWFKHSIMGNTLIHSFSITGYRVLSIIYCHTNIREGLQKKHKIFRTFAIYGGRGVSPQKCFFFKYRFLKRCSTQPGQGRGGFDKKSLISKLLKFKLWSFPKKLHQTRFWVWANTEGTRQRCASLIYQIGWHCCKWRNWNWINFDFIYMEYGNILVLPSVQGWPVGDAARKNGKFLVFKCHGQGKNERASKLKPYSSKGCSN